MQKSQTAHPQLSPTEDSLKEFWAEIANQTLNWISPWHSVLDGGFKQGDVRWFSGGTLNVSINCIDRHLPEHKNQPAIIWEGDEAQQQRQLSFGELAIEVNRFANALKVIGIKKGDTVAIYLPMIPEAAIAMLACARIGAVHTVIFAGFSAHALKQRLIASNCLCLITADGFQRGGKPIPLKTNADEASEGLHLKKIIVQHKLWLRIYLL